METLLSVGIDIGTTTTQLVISRLTLENTRSSFSVPNFEIAKKEVLFRSSIHFTPLKSDTEIDAQGVREIPFDVLLLGADHGKHAAWQEALAWCAAHGKKVMRTTRTEGISSTTLRDRIRHLS